MTRSLKTRKLYQTLRRPTRHKSTQQLELRGREHETHDQDLGPNNVTNRKWPRHLTKHRPKW